MANIKQEQAYEFAAKLKSQGKTDRAIKQALVAEQGLDDESANAIINDLSMEVKAIKRESGKKNMLFGALWAVGGGGVTAYTYFAASPGGSYMIAWGAVIFGTVQFFQGIYQYYTGR